MSEAGGHRGRVLQRLLPLLALALSLTPAAGSVAPASGAAPTPPRVTVFGDSVATAIPGTTAAMAILSQGIDLQDEMVPCRRVEQQSCPYQTPSGSWVRPPTVLDRIRTLGSKLGETVVVAVGYDDFVDQYAKNIEDALAALKAAGVKHVLWLTMTLVAHQYISMNNDIQEAATNHPELQVVDWGDYSRGHPDWFQPDGLHLLAPGAIQMATLIHSKLVELGIPLTPPKTTPGPRLQVVTVRLRDARLGRAYAGQLQAMGGKPPYRWRILQGLPRGLHLAPAGRLTGIPKGRPGLLVVRVQVRDAGGAATARALTLHLLPSRKAAK